MVYLRHMPDASGPSKVLLHGKRRIFDQFFKIDEAELSYERFDGAMTPIVKRLCFERGDSVVAVVGKMRGRRRFSVLAQQMKGACDSSPASLLLGPYSFGPLPSHFSLPPFLPLLPLPSAFFLPASSFLLSSPTSPSLRPHGRRAGGEGGQDGGRR